MKIAIGVAVMCAALVLACSASKMSARSAPPQMNSDRPQTTVDGDPRKQIEDLDKQIETERTQMGLAAATPMTTCPDCPIAPVEPFAVPPNSKQDPTCRPARKETCTQSCTLSDSICVNADKICRLAQQLQGDKWAADKCSSGKTTCETAHASCCACQ